MGTRSLIKIVSEGETKVAQYCQWDGYPSGQGAGCLRALKGIQLDHFKAKVNKCKFVPDKETDASEWEKADKYNNRNHGSEVLNMIRADEADTIYLFSSEEWGKEGLGCEYIWLIDLDKMEFGEANSKLFDINNLPSEQEFTEYYKNLYSEDED